jgi:3-hydroxyacyl-[acyl-carrier-protein] dehydratase
MLLTKEQIKKIIPHRDPFLLVDSVEELVPEKSIVAHFYVDPSRDIFLGHFPDAPVLPGVYTVECMAQASDVMLCSLERYSGKIPYFIGINNAKFMSKIAPGDTIRIQSQMMSERKEKAIAMCYVEVYNGQTLAASGEVTLALR